MAVYCPIKAGPALYQECLECPDHYPVCAERFFCLVAGTRTFSDYAKLKQALDRLLQNHAPQSVVIVHGGARGADALAGQYAKERGMKTVVFPADWTSGKKAGYERNHRMHEYLSHFAKRGCVLFWDGRSRGTQHSIALANEFGTPLRIIHIS